MKLQKKILIRVVGILIIVLSVGYLLVSRQLQDDFFDAELNHVQANVESVKDKLQGLVNELIEDQADWAAWDDTYNFVVDRNASFISSNLTNKSIAHSVKVNLIAIIDNAGHIIFSKMLDIDNLTEVSIPDEIAVLLGKDTILTRFNSVTETVGGLLPLSDGKILIVAARPIITTNLQGPIRGSIVWATYLNHEIKRALSREAHFLFSLAQAPPQAILDQIQVRVISPDLIMGSTVIRDLRSAPSLSLSVRMPRPIYNQGVKAAYFVIFYLILSLVAVTGLILVYVKILVINRLKKIGTDLDGIKSFEHNSKRVHLHGNDELTELALSINNMLISLESSITLLRIEELRFRTLSENSPVGILNSDSSGLCIYANKFFCDMTGLKREEALGQGWLSIVHPDDFTMMYQHWVNSIMLKKNFELEYRCRNTSGEIIWVYLVTRFMSLSPKSDVECLSILVDITQLKQAKDNISTLRERMLHLQKMEAIGRVSTGIAHDFNNMLGSILGYAHLLRTGNADVGQNTKLDVIIESCNRAAQLTREMLGFSRRGLGERKKLNLNDVVQSATNIVRPSLNKKINIKLKLASDLCMIQGDQNKLIQALVNLSINARDAMDENGQITIATQNYDPTQDEIRNFGLKNQLHVKLELIDNGSGIPDHIREHIFEPFITTKGEGKGTGLGLALVYNTVVEHQGIIYFDSSLVGTTFHLLFPALFDSATENSVEDHSMVKGAAPSLYGKKILVVDDEPNLRLLLREFFEEQGASVATAENGYEAVAILSQESDNFDAVVLDVIMPTMDGVTACRQLRQQGIVLPIVFTSGYAESDEISKLRKDRSIYFVQKPYKTDLLLEMVVNALTSAN